MPALVTAGVMHVALLWLALQAAPAVQSARQVMVQLLAPITLLREKPPVPPAAPLRAVNPVRERTPSPALSRSVKAIESPPEKPVPPRPQPPVPPPPVAAPPEPVVPEPPAPSPLPPPPKPEPAPVPEPVPEPVPVPVPAPAPAPAVARPVAITPVDKAPVLPEPGGPGGGQPASGAVKLPPGLYPYLMKNAPRQRSLAEMANEQINGGRQRDKVAEGIAGAAKPDCIGPNNSNGLFSVLTIPIAAAMDKCK